MRLSLFIFCLSTNRAISTPALWVIRACSALQLPRTCESCLVLTWLEVVKLSAQMPLISLTFSMKRGSYQAVMEEREWMAGRTKPW